MPTLDQLNKNSGFLLPDNYFVDLEDVVLIKIRHQKRKMMRRRLYLSAASVAAVALLILSLTLFIPQNRNSFFTQMITTSPIALSDDSIGNNIEISSDISGVVNETSSSPDQLLAQTIQKTEWDNIDYQIMEFYNDDFSYSEMIDSYY